VIEIREGEREERRHTLNRKISQQLVGIGSIDELDKVDLGILRPNHGCDVDGGVLVEAASGLQGFFERRSLEFEVCKVGDAGLLGLLLLDC